MIESASGPQESLEDLIKRLESLIADGKGTDSWIRELSIAADRAQLSITQLRSITTNLTWIDRRLAHPVPTESNYCRDAGIGGLLHLYTHGQRLRFDFNFSGLSVFLENHRDLPHIEDALVQSFSAFAKLGARAPGAVDQLMHTLDLEDLDFRARHVCLAGLWSAHTLPEQAVLLLELANEMISLGEGDSNVYFRRATAYRMMGKFSEALDDIDYALALLAPGNNEVHQDYLRERQLIGVAFQSYSRRDI
jgi:tetratricopeptide (TPR) repeat protein